MEITIKELNNEVLGEGSVKNIKYSQQLKSEKAYLYKVSQEQSSWYEVFERKSTPICLDFDNRIYSETEFKEIYPKDKDFGQWAWCYTNFEKALNKFHSI